MQSMLNFIDLFSDMRLRYHDRLIWNVDQSGFQYEPTTDRTLTFRGERDVVVSIDQASHATHSYTIQPIISRDGRPIGKLLICLKERGGRFGPRVEAEVRSLERDLGNIEVVASESGKMTINLMVDWAERVVRPAMRENFRAVNGNGEFEEDEPSRDEVLLLADSWGGNTNQRVVSALGDLGIRFLQVPAGTTQDIQPLDVGFFRYYKYFFNRVLLQAQMENRTNEVTSRSGILRVHNRIWNQLQAPVYSDLIRYAWRTVDFSFEARDELASPRHPRTTMELQFSNVDGNAFMRCAHDGRPLTLDEFLDGAHVHEVEENDLEEVVVMQEERDEPENGRERDESGFFEMSGEEMVVGVTPALAISTSAPANSTSAPISPPTVNVTSTTSSTTPQPRPDWPILMPEITSLQM